jgi:C_GCAxxG_C_C family probable redox protein
MASPADIAASYFNQSYCCSQSVFMAFAASLDLEREKALKISSPFGGGLGRRGEVCGAITGALMALGLARSSGEPAGKEEIYRRTQEFIRLFEEKHGTLLCRDLIACDLSTPAGLQAATEKQVFTNICTGLVQDAVEILQEQLETT